MNSQGAVMGSWVVFRLGAKEKAAGCRRRFGLEKTAGLFDDDDVHRDRHQVNHCIRG